MAETIPLRDANCTCDYHGQSCLRHLGRNDEGLTWLEWSAAAGCNPRVTGVLEDEWRTGVDPTEYRANPAKRDLLALGAGHVLLTPSDALDFERRWLAECRAHGETKRKLAAAHHELGDHSLCDPRDCEGDRD